MAKSKGPKPTKSVRRNLGSEEAQAKRAEARKGKGAELESLRADENNLTQGFLGERTGSASTRVTETNPFSDNVERVQKTENLGTRTPARMEDVAEREGSAQRLEKAGFEKTAQDGMQEVSQDVHRSENENPKNKGRDMWRVSDETDAKIDDAAPGRFRPKTDVWGSEDTEFYKRQSSKDTAVEGLDATEAIGKGAVEAARKGGNVADRSSNPRRGFGSRLGHFFGRNRDSRGPAADSNPVGWSDEAIDRENEQIGAARMAHPHKESEDWFGRTHPAIERAQKSARTPHELASSQYFTGKGSLGRAKLEEKGY